MRKLYFVIFIFIVLISCNKEEANREFPSVTTLSEIVITEEGVSVSASIDAAWISEIVDYGFVYYNARTNGTSTIKVSLGKTPLNGDSFSTKLERSLETDEEYIYKAYVMVDNFTVYGNEQRFISMGGKAPALSAFSPVEAWIGDTLSISGDFFSDSNNDNTVYFGPVSAHPVFSSDSLLRVVVPVSVTTASAPLRVEVAGKSAVSANVFKIKYPAIEQILPDRLYPGESFIVKGKGLYSLTQLIVDEQKLSAVSKSDSMTVFELSYDVQQGTKPLKFMMLDTPIELDRTYDVWYPEITSVSPSTAWIDTVLTVKGKGLDLLENFFLEGIQLEKLSVLDTIAKLHIAGIFNTSHIKAQFFNRILEFEPVVKLNMPVITSITPSLVYPGDQVTLTGERFFYGMSSSIGTIQRVEGNTAILALPFDLTAGDHTIDLIYFADRSVGTIKFTVPKIRIVDYSPKNIMRGDTVNIEMENFPEESWFYSCFIGNTSAEVIQLKGNVLKVVVPMYADYSSNPDLTVSLGGQQAKIENAFHLTEYWTKIEKNFPLTGGDCSFVENNGNHFVLFQGQTSAALRKFNNTTEEWLFVNRTEVLNSTRILTTFSLGDYLYFISKGNNGESVNYRYSVSNDSWERLADYPLSVQYLAKMYSFTFDDYAFVGSIDGLYKYFPETNTWEKKTTLPTTHYELLYSMYFNSTDNGYVAFETSLINDVEYNEFWKYQSSSDTWIDLGDAPTHVLGGGSGIILENQAYIIGRGYQVGGESVMYDLANDTKRKLRTPPGILNSNFYLFREGDTIYFMSRPDYYEGWNMYKIPVSDLDKLYY